MLDLSHNLTVGGQPIQHRTSCRKRTAKTFSASCSNSKRLVGITPLRYDKPAPYSDSEAKCGVVITCSGRDHAHPFLP